MLVAISDTADFTPIVFFRFSNLKGVLKYCVIKCGAFSDPFPPCVINCNHLVGPPSP